VNQQRTHSVRLARLGNPGVRISIGLGPNRAEATLTIEQWSELIAFPEAGLVGARPRAFPARCCADAPASA
jgi:hypothetical protein